MVKCCGHYVTFQEVPNEISLVLSITNCPYRCAGCHSPWLQEDIGDELTDNEVMRLVKEYKDGITCVCFMGEGTDIVALSGLIKFVCDIGLKTCLYSGRDIATDLSQYAVYPILDYIKTGSYKQELGGLDQPTTNQRMWKLCGFDENGVSVYEDITAWFWRKKE